MIKQFNGVVRLFYMVIQLYSYNTPAKSAYYCVDYIYAVSVLVDEHYN